MRLGAVSPPPPGAGPRYRSQCCWPAPTAPGSVSRIPLLTTTPINSLDIISCANRRINEDATSELPQQATVRDHVLYSTKCLLKNQLKRCALVRPQVYARLCETATEEEDFNLDRLPRFRFGGNRATTNKVRDFEKRVNDQRLKDLTERLKRGPIPPPRTRHTPKTPPEDPIRVTPLRSASFSQVDYSSDDKKYVRRRNPICDTTQAVATLPRSKNQPRPENFKETNSEEPERETEKQPITRSNTISSTPNTQEKKRDKLRRRKGIYISQWPNTTENVIPQFVEDGDFASCSDPPKLPEEPSEEKNRDLTMWTSPQEEPLSPEDNTTVPEWPKINRGMFLLRSDSLSEGEPEIGERKAEITSAPSDVSDCESRLSLGNDNVPRRYSKRPLRGPYGQMLEAEMKKPETGRKNQLNNDLKFLEDLNRDVKAKHRSRSSIDDSKGSFNNLSSPKQLLSLSKRKVSADSLVVENDQRLVVNHQRTTSSPSKLEGFANTEVSQELLEQLLRGSSEQLATSDANLQQKNVSGFTFIGKV